MKNKNIIILCIIVSLICLVATITLALHIPFIVFLQYWWVLLILMILYGSTLIFCVILYISDLLEGKKSKNKKRQKLQNVEKIMKCPYMKTVIDYTHTSTVYNSDGLVKEVISQNIYIDNMRVCIKDDCAAWRNGKCYYKGR